MSASKFTSQPPLSPRQAFARRAVARLAHPQVLRARLTQAYANREYSNRIILVKQTRKKSPIPRPFPEGRNAARTKRALQQPEAVTRPLTNTLLIILSAHARNSLSLARGSPCARCEHISHSDDYGAGDIPPHQIDKKKRAKPQNKCCK